MKYTLNFSLKPDLQDQLIVYDEGGFTEQPIIISVPAVVEILDHFIKFNSFNQVGVVEKSLNKPKSVSSKKKIDKDDASKELSIDSISITQPTTLKLICTKAYVCQTKQLDKEALAQICAELTKYLQECCSRISDDFLSDDNNLHISGLREVLEVRNYLAKYTKSEKKHYQDGYLYIAAP